MDIFVTGFQAAYNFMVFFLYCYELHKLLMPRYGSKSFKYMLSLEYLMLIFTFLTPSNAITLREILLFSTIVFSSCLLYEEHFLWKLLCSIILLLGIALPEGLAMFILTYLFHLTTEYVLHELYFIWIPLMLLFTYLFLYIIRKLFQVFKISIMNQNNSAHWIIVLFVVNNMIFPASLMIAPINQNLLYLYLFLNILSLYAFYKLFRFYGVSLFQKKITMLSKQQLKDYLESYDKCTSKLQFIRHDLMNDLKTLAVLISDTKEES